MTHELKILPEYFEAVRRGIKTFELRKTVKNLCIDCLNYIPDEKDKLMGICAVTGKTLCEYTRRPPLCYGCKRNFLRKKNND